MKLRELTRRLTILDNVSAFAGATRNPSGGPVEIYVGIRGNDCSDLYSIDLTRSEAEKLIADLTAALLVQPHTPEEIANHEQHMAYRKFREEM